MKYDVSFEALAGALVFFVAFILLGIVLEPSSRKAIAEREAREAQKQEWIEEHSWKLRTHFEIYPSHRFNFKETSQYCDVCRAIKFWSN